MKKRVLVAQLGARMHYAIPIIFEKRGLLKSFVTDFYLLKNEHKIIKSKLDILPSFFKNMVGRRSSEIPDSKIKRSQSFGLIYNLMLRNAKSRASETKSYLWAGKKICDKTLKLNISNYDIFYGFNTDSKEILLECKKHNVFSILEQTIASKRYHNEILVEEHTKWPLLEPNFTEEYVDQVVNREKAEWEYANIVVCASEFVKESILKEGIDSSKVHVVPYGVKQPEAYVKKSRQYFHVIFVGNFGLRKGGIYFLQAAEKLAKKNIKFTVIGSVKLDQSIVNKYKEFVNFTGSISRDKVRDYYLDADVMCLPSLCEGSATVSYEALSYGVPLITTFNSGTVVNDAQEGIIIPIRDSNAIVKSIEKLKSNPDLLLGMSIKAKEKSYEYTWDKYEERLMNLIIKESNYYE
jgi:glycosyltransferase involved in cell wall biosynthesis